MEKTKNVLIHTVGLEINIEYTTIENVPFIKVTIPDRIEISFQDKVLSFHIGSEIIQELFPLRNSDYCYIHNHEMHIYLIPLETLIRRQ